MAVEVRLGDQVFMVQESSGQIWSKEVGVSFKEERGKGILGDCQGLSRACKIGQAKEQ